EVEMTTPTTQEDIYKLAADINAAKMSPSEKDVMLSRLHRVEKLAGSNVLPQVPPGKQLETFNDGNREWPVAPSREEFRRLLAGRTAKYRATGMTHSAAIDKAMADDDVKAAYTAERDQRLVQASKMHGG